MSRSQWFVILAPLFIVSAPKKHGAKKKDLNFIVRCGIRVWRGMVSYRTVWYHTQAVLTSARQATCKKIEHFGYNISAK
jgi:hypothetical protein